jgi:hypothetical protein
MLEIINFEELNLRKQTLIAKYVSDYTHSLSGQQAKMKPVTFEEVMFVDEFEFPLVALKEGEYAGYIRAGERYIKDSWTYQKIGSLIVPAALKGQGIAKELVIEATRASIFTHSIQFSCCNSIGEAVFKSVGYEIALPGKLPEETVSLYGNQSMIYAPAKI